jgi:Tripartite tricarboxylate transporter TctB family
LPICAEFSGNPAALLLESAAMLTTDRVSGIALALFSLLVIWQSRLLPLGTFRQPGPAYIPVLLASLLLIFGVFLAVTARRAPLFSSLSWTEWRHALAILAACIFAGFGMERLGYRVTLLLVLSFLLKIMEECGWVLTILFSMGLAFGSFFLFHTILRVPLPQGPLGF